MFVDAYTKWMRDFSDYWIDSAQGVIAGSAMDGSDTRILHRLSATDSKSIRVSVDSASSHLFFIDSEQQSISRINLPNGGNNKRIVEAPGIVALATDPMQG